MILLLLNVDDDNDKYNYHESYLKQYMGTNEVRVKTDRQKANARREQRRMPHSLPETTWHKVTPRRKANDVETQDKPKLLVPIQVVKMFVKYITTVKQSIVSKVAYNAKVHILKRIAETTVEYTVDMYIDLNLRDCAPLELEDSCVLPVDDVVVVRVCPQIPEPESKASGTMTAGFPPLT